jgi:hypothetical protein
MDFNHIEKKKPFYRIKAGLKDYLKQNSRLGDLPISYNDLLDFKETFLLKMKMVRRPCGKWSCMIEKLMLT